MRLLRWLLGLTAAALLAGFAVAAWLYFIAATDVTGGQFDNPLHVPPLAERQLSDDGVVTFDLEVQEGESQLIDGHTTGTWGVNGSYLGPTLRARVGEEVQVNVANRLQDITTMHWHGMHLPAAMDGGPRQEIEPGETWSPHWTIDQPAATLWYHPHQMGLTADHVYRGVAGLFILDDPDGDKPQLPSEYGVDDIPVIVQDKSLNPDGSLRMNEGPANLVGVLGDHTLVNGTHRPYVEATTTLIRLRVLNASNARVYNLGFDDDRTYWMIGSDSGLLEAPIQRQRLQVSPGERAEIVVSVRPGETARLSSFPPDLGMNPLLERFNGGHDTFDLLEIRAAQDLVESPALPEELAAIDHPDPSEAAAERTFELSGFSEINDKKMDMARLDVAVTKDTSEVWNLQNSSNTYHNFHVHDVHFAVLDIDGREPPPRLQGWKDTLFLPPGTTARIVSRFEDYADPNYPFMFHCHILRHEDAGMMGQFVVVEGEAGTTPEAWSPP